MEKKYFFRYFIICIPSRGEDKLLYEIIQPKSGYLLCCRSCSCGSAFSDRFRCFFPFPEETLRTQVVKMALIQSELPLEDVLVTSESDLGVYVNNGSEYSADELNNIRVYEALNEAVVNITTEVVGYNWFLEPVPKEGSSGSGSIIDKRGFVLTNNHVVDKAYKVYITLADGSQYEGGSYRNGF